MISRICVFCIPVLVILALPSYSDTLMMKNNSQAIGKILQETPDEFIVDINGNQLTLRRADVLYIIQNNVRREISGATQAISLPPVAPVTDTVQPPSNNSQMIPFPPAKSESPVSNPVMGPKISQPLQETPVVKPVTKEETSVLLPLILPSVKAYQVTSTGAGVIFRDGPSIDYKMIDTLPSQAILSEIEIADGWLHARNKDNKEGWVHMNFVQPLDSIPCMVNSANVQVRELPGELYRVLGKIQKGDIVIKLKEQGDWTLIISGPMTGYCHKSYLAPLVNVKNLRPPMKAVSNEAANTPILVQKSVINPSERKIIFTIRDEQIVIDGMTKLMVLFPKKEQLKNDINYVSSAIVQRQRISSSADLVSNGLPEQFGISYVGCDVLTLQGQHSNDGWQYDITVPADDAITFAFVVQKGISRGFIVTIP